MKERTEGTTDLTGLKVLAFFCIITLLVPVAILLLCAVLTSWHQYPLSTNFAVAYVLSGIASPIMGVLGLLIVLAQKRAFGAAVNRADRRLRGFILVLSVMNILAIALWVMFSPYLIFSIGGTR